jgi:two-component system OmpR family sensor kinase
MSRPRRWWRVPRTLRARITVSYAAALVLMVACITVVAYVWLSAGLQSAVADDLRARLDDISRAPSNDVTADPYAQLIRDGVVVSHSSAAPATPVLDPSALRDVAGGRPRTVTVPGMDGDALVAGRPAAGGGTLVVAASLAPAESAENRLLATLIATGSLLALGAVLAVRRLVHAALAPVAVLTAEAETITAQSSGRRLAEPAGGDEIATLAATLNRMLDRLAASYRRERAFVDDAAHELRTPVSVLRAELELAASAHDEQGVRRSVRAALVETDRLARLSDDLLALARARAGALHANRAPTDVTGMIRGWSRRVGEVNGIKVLVEGEELVATVDPVRLQQVVTNLLANAAQAGASTVRVAVGHGPHDGVCLTVDDDGPGFADGVLALAFDRFSRGQLARTRGGPAGAGRGLALVAEIAGAHGGSASAGNDSPLGGARVRVVLPG